MKMEVTIIGTTTCSLEFIIVLHLKSWNHDFWCTSHKVGLCSRIWKHSFFLNFVCGGFVQSCYTCSSPICGMFKGWTSLLTLKFRFLLFFHLCCIFFKFNFSSHHLCVPISCRFLWSCSLIVTNFFFQSSVVMAYVMLYLPGSICYGTIYVISLVSDMP